jgi:hypothetical protein
MKFTETIETLEFEIGHMERCLKDGHDGDSVIWPIKGDWRHAEIAQMACAIEVLKNNEK